MRPFRYSAPLARASSVVAVTLLLAACSDSPVSGPSPLGPSDPTNAIVALDCEATVVDAALVCQPSQASGDAGASHNIIGGQNLYVTLAASNFFYDGWEFGFYVTVKNLLNEAMGTPDGTLVDTAGVRVFFAQQPTVTASTGPGGTVTIANKDGIGTFTAVGQPYYKYSGILAKNATSAPRHWMFEVSPQVTAFRFTVYISTTLQALLVINEVLANPGGTISDANGEWFEVYNAGTLPVNLQGYAIADSAASGRRPYHLILSSLVVAPGGYVVLGSTTNATNNGGVAVDYA